MSDVGVHRRAGGLGETGIGEIDTQFDIAPILFTGVGHGHLLEQRDAGFDPFPGLVGEAGCGARGGFFGQRKHSITSERHSIRTDTPYPKRISCVRAVAGRPRTRRRTSPR